VPPKRDESVRVRRLLASDPDGEPLWVRLYVQEIGEKCSALIVADEEAPPEAGTGEGLAFFGHPAEEAERLALAYLGEGVAQN
jgi:hypothetical protein